MYDQLTYSLGDALLIAALCQLCIFIIFLVLNRKGNWRLNLMLAIVLVFTAVPILSTFILAQGSTLRSYFPLAHIGNATVFIVGPFLFVYVRKYLTGRVLSFKADLLHFAFFMCVLALFFVMAKYQSNNYTYQNIDILSSFCLLSYTLVYFIFTLGLILRHRKIPISERRSVYWSFFLFIGYLILFSGRFAIFITWEVLSLSSMCPYTYNLYFMTFILFTNTLVLLAFQGFKVFRHQAKYRHSRLSYDEKIVFGKQIRERMESEKLYLDPLLTLDSMSRLLGISSKYLSQTINECFSMNFSDFINSFRVKEFIRLLKQDTKNQTILNISIDAGFNSKSTFNQAFKKHTGSSPRNFLKKITQKKTLCSTVVYADSICPVPNRDASIY